MHARRVREARIGGTASDACAGMGTCLPAVTEALAATPGVASSAGKTWPYWQIPQSACSVTRGYGFHTVEVNHTRGSKSDTPPCHAMASTCACDSLRVPSRMLGGDLLVFLVALFKNARRYACGAAARVLVVTLGLDAVRFLPIMYVMRRTDGYLHTGGLVGRLASTRARASGPRIGHTAWGQHAS